jgi:hypothetical protein
LKNKHWIGICREPEGEEDRSKPGKDSFMVGARKQEYAAQYGERLRGCRATESDGDAPHMCSVPNGTKGYVTTTNNLTD